MIKKLLYKTLKKMGYHVVKRSNLVSENVFEDLRYFFDSQTIDIIIFDVGAHIGNISQRFYDTIENCKIYAFEPFSESFKELEIRFENNLNILPFHFGLGDSEAFKEININSNTQTNSFFKSLSEANFLFSGPHFDNMSKESVKINTIDNFCTNNNINQIDILKLDVQGYELNVLRGASKFLYDKKIKYIYLEISVLATYNEQPTIFQIFDYLYQFNFKLYNIYNIYRKENKGIVQFDALFYI